MFKNYLKAAFRNLWKNKTYSFLNIFGLGIGIACAALIFLWVENEWNYDQANIKKNQLYVVLENEVLSAHTVTHASTPGPMAPVMKTEIPGIVNTCRTTEADKPYLFSVGDHSVFAKGRYVDSTIFSMFTLPFVQGSAKNAFPNLASIVITESAAKKFFGSAENVIGRILRMDNASNFVVTGVLKDIPKNSSLQFEWLISFELFYKQNDFIRKWTNNSLTTYVELNPLTSPVAVNRQLADYIQKREAGSNIHLFLFGMPEWHLRWQFENGKQTGGGAIQYVRMFSIIAWIILFIACINFMNLSTARSEKRAREVGVRKVLGAGKSGLVTQFIGEALIMAGLATISALLIMSLVLPAFNSLVQKDLATGLQNPEHLVALVMITLICGLVAGSYPSLYLSSFNPVSVLKGLKMKSGSAAIIRKGLVIMQFSISIVLIISTFIIYQQIRHIKNRDLGFNKDNLIALDVQGEMRNHFDAIRRDLINTSVVENAALSDHGTLYGGNNTDGFAWDGKPPSSKVVVSTRYVSPDFFSTSGIHLLEGRNVREGDTMYSHRLNVVVSQSMANLLGKGSALSKFMWFEGDTADRVNIVGVVNDYVYGDMYGRPDPVMFFYGPPQNATVMYIRTKAGADLAQALAKIGAVMKMDNPLYPFEYSFVDEQFNGMFITEMLMGKLSRVFAALAIIISCLGLFGLAAYTAERRIKEIGIRKVLGASVSGITRLLSKDFLGLVAVSCIIAFPVAWWAMSTWLQNYAYHIQISWWIFFAAGLLAMLIALVTVSFQAIRAAIANPVKSLKTD